MKPETFQILFLTFFILEGIWQFILSRMNVRWIVGRSKIVPGYLKGSVSAEELEKAAAYTVAKTRLENLSSLLEKLFVVILVAFGLIGLLDSSLAGLGSDYWRAGLFFAVLMIAQEVFGVHFSFFVI